MREEEVDLEALLEAQGQPALGDMDGGWSPGQLPRIDSGVHAPLPGAPLPGAPLSPRPTGRDEEEHSRYNLDRLSTNEEFRSGLRSILGEYPTPNEELRKQLKSYFVRHNITKLDANDLRVLLTKLRNEGVYLARANTDEFRVGLRAVFHRTNEKTTQEKQDAYYQYFRYNNIPLEEIFGKEGFLKEEIKKILDEELAKYLNVRAVLPGYLT